jgi:uncharacterized protein
VFTHFGKEEQARMKIDTVVIQPTPFCNLDCRYCYLPYRANTSRMTFATLERIFKLVLPSRFVEGEIVVIWHAGEPLVLPLDFYQEALKLQQRWNTSELRIVNAFQTNGTLITQAWCDFFKRNNIRVGVSLDGPEYIQDAQRRNRAGHGSFRRVMDGIKLLQDNDISFGIIAVVTEFSLQYPDELWHFFSALHPVRLGFNPEETGGANQRSTLSSDTAIERYRTFFKRIIELSAQSDGSMIVREIEHPLGSLLANTSLKRFVTNVPLKYLNFDYNGNISSFAPELMSAVQPAEQTLIFGNVRESSLEDVIHHPRFIEVCRKIEQGVEMCRETCDYYMFCGGGCPSNKLFEHGTFATTETRACQLHIKVPVGALVEYLEAIYKLR